MPRTSASNFIIHDDNITPPPCSKQYHVTLHLNDMSNLWFLILTTSSFMAGLTSLNQCKRFLERTSLHIDRDVLYIRCIQTGMYVVHTLHIDRDVRCTYVAYRQGFTVHTLHIDTRQGCSLYIRCTQTGMYCTYVAHRQGCSLYIRCTQTGMFVVHTLHIDRDVLYIRCTQTGMSRFFYNIFFEGQNQALCKSNFFLNFLFYTFAFLKF